LLRDTYTQRLVSNLRSFPKWVLSMRTLTKDQTPYWRSVATRLLYDLTRNKVGQKTGAPFNLITSCWLRRSREQSIWMFASRRRSI